MTLHPFFWILIGYGLAHAVIRLRGRFLMWRLERDYARSVARMRACAHADTIDVNIAGPDHPFCVPKCTSCWALRLRDGWSPNSAPPPRP